MNKEITEFIESYIKEYFIKQEKANADNIRCLKDKISNLNDEINDLKHSIQSIKERQLSLKNYQDDFQDMEVF